MTLRELLNVVFNTGSLFQVMSKIEQVYHDNTSDQIQSIMKCYTLAAQEMLDLTSTPGCEDQSIRLKNVTDDTSEYVDVHLYSEQTDETFAISYTDWSELIDLPITMVQQFDMVDQLAHILWELTFHGFSRDAVAKARAELYATIDEAEKHPENLIPWEDFLTETEQK